MKLEVKDDDTLGQDQKDIKILAYTDVQMQINGISAQEEPCNRDTEEFFSANLINAGNYDVYMKVKFYIDEAGQGYMGSTQHFWLKPEDGHVQSQEKDDWVPYNWPNDPLPLPRPNAVHIIYATPEIDSDTCFVKDSVSTNDVSYREFQTYPKYWPKEE